MPKTPDYFHGKTIVITGAGSGIGRATALIFAREGANVVCADINEKGVEETAEEINAIGAQALALTIDVTKRAAVEDMVQLALDGFGRVHFLFNSAGAAHPALQIPRHRRRPVRAHLRPQCQGHVLRHAGGAAAYAGEQVRRDRQRRQHGGKRGGPGTSVHYAAAKGAVITMTMGVAREFAAQGIRALSISPGPIDTAFPGGGGHLAGAHAADAQRRADEALRPSRRRSANWCCSCARMPASS